MPSELNYYRMLRAAFLLSAVTFSLAIGLGVYDSVISDHRIPPLNPSYFPEVEALLDQGDNEHAIRQLRLAAKLDFPARAEIYNNLGNAYKNAGRFDEAVVSYRESLRFKPDSSTTHFNLSVTLHRQGSIKQAEDHLREALQLNPDFVEANARLGRILLAQEEYHEAVKFYDAALRLKEDDLATLNDLSWLLATCVDEKIRDGQRAVTLAERAGHLTDHANFSMLDSLSAAHAEAGNFAEAIRWQTKALELAPEAKKARLRRRLELYQAGKPFRDAPAKPTDGQ